MNKTVFKEDEDTNIATAILLKQASSTIGGLLQDKTFGEVDKLKINVQVRRAMLTLHKGQEEH